ncbi:helix-turn-helix domain-containing protein [Lentzea cavernae]|uniref:XRE family transcriptional regulator n=1 Tax=Lentzea cavernae TaxID=2020703 RepID=A0ABQ3MSL1_9PSEU|nr:helix-turn-helix transcriptional regulator [Lentzea cavernae]GHH56863.1 XRE family transcriptional regulator [Lentzea cavernae]
MERFKAWWDRPEMRDALAHRDIGTVFRLLVEEGVSQREIAQVTRQNQSEISEIIGGRRVMSYELLERIAVSLGVPRGHVGLEYGVVSPQPAQDEAAKRASFLARAAEAVVGQPVFGEAGEVALTAEETPVPAQVGPSDVVMLHRVLGDLTGLESQFGGGVVLAAVEGQLRWARRLLGVAVRDAVRPALFEAVALLHRRASSAAFDMGRLDRARKHLLAALELTQDAQNLPLQAMLFYCAGRMEQYHGPPDAALRLFQFGYPVALASRSPRLCALLEVREARCYAVMGNRESAERALSSAMENFHAEGDLPVWLEFFDEAELLAAVGVTWAELGEWTRAVAAIRRSLRHRGDGVALARSFDLAELATCHLRSGDVDEGVRVATRSLDLVEQLNSNRARDRLGPLERAARRGGSETSSVVHRITETRERKVTAS